MALSPDDVNQKIYYQNVLSHLIFKYDMYSQTAQIALEMFDVEDSMNEGISPEDAAFEIHSDWDSK